MTSCALRAFFLAVVLVAVAAAPAGADASAIAWQSPSPAPGSVLTIEAGKKASFTFTAGAVAVPTALIKLKASNLPRGATFKVKAGNPATGVFSWRPSGPQIGDRTLTVAAQAKAPAGVAPTSLPLTLHVVPGYTQLTTPTVSFSHWAFVDAPTTVRAAPSRHSFAVGRIVRWTPENYPNLLLLLKERYQQSGWWVQARLSTLPNGRTGWIPRSVLGSYHENTAHLWVNRSALSATLTKDGKRIFTTRVGIGRPYWPTPPGQFYIREKVTGFRNPMYGPIAYGTSARSPVLTDWPGGGFIGVHGTNEPGLIPGRISHGCVRMRNSAILKLARLLPLGTPMTIS